MDIVVDNCNFFDIHDGFEKCSDKHSVYYSNKNNDYICTNELEISNILRDFKNYLIFFHMINGYNISLQIWSTSIKKESDVLPFLIITSILSFGLFIIYQYLNFYNQEILKKVFSSNI